MNRLLMSGLTILVLVSGCTISQLKSPLLSDKPERKMIFDGTQFSSGAGWAAAAEEIDLATISTVRTTGFDDSSSLLFQASGSNYLGFGWNWLDLWEKSESGDDISEYEAISFLVKAEGEKLPDHHTISFHLASGGDPLGRSTSQQLVKYSDPDEDILDGEWHRITFPLSVFAATRESGHGMMRLDSAREFSIGVGSETYIDFNLYIDNVELIP